jgi:predicted PurR-regulated permease PerM
VQEIPTYEAQIREHILRLVDWLAQHDINVSRSRLISELNPGSAMRLMANLLTSVGGLLTNAVLIFLTAVFILLEASSFSDKIRLNVSSAEATLAGFKEFATRLNKYVVIKSAMSLATGIAVASWTRVCGLQFWLLWGLLAFLFNYIPNLGSILAAIPAIMLALLKYGLGGAIIVALGYLAINLILSNLLEPRFLGRGLGLSTLVVFVSLFVWAWILGPVGVLLAVPLTMTVKIALSSTGRTRWIAALLGPEISEAAKDEAGPVSVSDGDTESLKG